MSLDILDLLNMLGLTCMPCISCRVTRWESTSFFITAILGDTQPVNTLLEITYPFDRSVYTPATLSRVTPTLLMWNQWLGQWETTDRSCLPDDRRLTVDGQAGTATVTVNYCLYIKPDGI